MSTLNLIQVGLILVAVMSALTMPDGELPSMAWRLHFGIVEMCFGVGAGIGVCLFVLRREEDDE